MAPITIEGMAIKYRLEKDSLGELHIPADKYWGPETQRALLLFQIGSEKTPLAFIRAFALQKKVAALANTQLGELSAPVGNAIVRAAEEVIDGKWDDHFPLSIWQDGAGSHLNMNLNEVIARRAEELLPPGNVQPIHPKDHVNCSQSTNDSFPTALHIAITRETHTKLLPSLNTLATALKEKAEKFSSLIKVGRTHLQDATPLTLGQEFSGYVTQIHLGIERIEESLKHIYHLAQGGTAVGTGVNSCKKFAPLFIEILQDLATYPFIITPNKFEALASRDACVNFSGALNTLAVSLMKIANDIKLLASGPRCGLTELFLPLNEPGTSIMPGKSNPTQAEALSMVATQVMGNNMAITIGGANGHLELNTFMPVIMYNVLQSIQLLADASQSFAENCIQGIEANTEKIASYLESTLMLVTALSPHIGYDSATKAAQTAEEYNISLKEAVLKLGLASSRQFDEWVNPRNMLSPH